MIELGYTKRNLLTSLCEGSDEPLIKAAMEDAVGRAWVAEMDEPKFCVIKVGNFIYLIGLPPKGRKALDLRSILLRECNNAYIVPENDHWKHWLEDNLNCNYRMVSRYTVKREKNSCDQSALKEWIEAIGAEYKLRKLDRTAFKKIAANEWSSDFTCNCDEEEFFLNGTGYVVYLDKEIVSGCSVYGFSEGKVEVTIATKLGHKRKGLAIAAAARYMLDCAREDRYPLWDTGSVHSIELAEKLGFAADGEYQVFQIAVDDDF